MTTATATAVIPATAASAAAPQRSSASGWVNWRASCFGQRRPRRRSSRFGPNLSSRRSASRPERPAGASSRTHLSYPAGGGSGIFLLPASLAAVAGSMFPIASAVAIQTPMLRFSLGASSTVSLPLSTGWLENLA